MGNIITHSSIFGILGSFCVFIGYTFYIRDILYGQTRPHAFSWLPWGTLAIITAIIQIQNGAGWAGIITMTGGALMMVTFLLSMKYGVRNGTQGDWILLLIIFILGIFWFITKEGLISIVLICTIDTFAFYFTWKKSYYHPYDEHILAYSIWTLGFLFSLLAVKIWLPVNWIYPGLLFCTEGGFTLFLWWRRKVTK